MEPCVSCIYLSISPIVCDMCEDLHYESAEIKSKSYTTSKNTINRQLYRTGAAVVSTITSYHELLKLS